MFIQTITPVSSVSNFNGKNSIDTKSYLKNQSLSKDSFVKSAPSVSFGKNSPFEELKKEAEKYKINTNETFFRVLKGTELDDDKKIFYQKQPFRCVRWQHNEHSVIGND